MLSLRSLNSNKILTLVLLSGWALWFLAVWTNNLSDLHLQQGNYLLIKKTTTIYQVTDSINLLLFILVILWQLILSGFFIYTIYLVLTNNVLSSKYIRIVYALSLALWLAFLIADEIFKNYAIVATHIRVFIAQSISLAILILINPSKQNGDQN